MMRKRRWPIRSAAREHPASTPFLTSTSGRGPICMLGSLHRGVDQKNISDICFRKMAGFARKCFASANREIGIPFRAAYEQRALVSYVRGQEVRRG